MGCSVVLDPLRILAESHKSELSFALRMECFWGGYRLKDFGSWRTLLGYNETVTAKDLLPFKQVATTKTLLYQQ